MRFTISFGLNGEKVSWFAVDWVDEYVGKSKMDKTLLSIIKLYIKLINKIDANKKELLVIPFESFVLNLYD